MANVALAGGALASGASGINLTTAIIILVAVIIQHPSPSVSVVNVMGVMSAMSMRRRDELEERDERDVHDERDGRDDRD